MDETGKRIVALAVVDPSKARRKVRAALDKEATIELAARSLGMSRSRLIRLMRELGVGLKMQRKAK